jgi:antitoxin (DNA-binding transcriptional repressor) of toxin-antitoxin stability system
MRLPSAAAVSPGGCRSAPTSLIIWKQRIEKGNVNLRSQWYLHRGSQLSDGEVNDARISDRMKATLEEVEKGAAEYLHRVIDGETIVVYEGKRAVAEIRPLTETDKLRPVGLAEGEFVVPDDFDDPLPDDLIDAFEGR